MRKRAYRAVGVKEISIQTVLPELAEGPIWMGLDIGKAEVFGVLRDSAGQFQRPWRVRQPTEVGQLVERLALLARHRPLVVAVESTGTYGDPLAQLPQLGTKFGISKIFWEAGQETDGATRLTTVQADRLLKDCV